MTTRVWLQLDAADWTDSDNRPGCEPLEGTAVRIFTAPWPLALMELPDGRQRWIHVRPTALEAAITEERT